MWTRLVSSWSDAAIIRWWREKASVVNAMDTILTGSGDHPRLPRRKESSQSERGGAQQGQAKRADHAQILLEDFKSNPRV